ncbi:MAG TPA: hypothetical protein VEA78_05300, partial [Acidimicrobiales bacterium]|nr:hypothetical protein [Acidimicrobiales bacterium]
TCASNLDFATAARNPHVTDPEQRYARGASPFCSGDQHYPSSASSTREMTTTFVVRAPSDTPWDPLSGEVVDTGSCRPTQYAGFEGPLAVELTAPGGNDALQQVFRRWVRLCTITTPVAGDYVLQVRTNVRPGATAAQMAGVGDRTTPGGGSNKYALRAAYVDPAGLPVPANVRVFSMSSMSIFANAPATTEFHLARLPSGSGGKTLVLSLFDIADATRPADLHMIGPPGTTFTGCSITGAVTRTLPDCVVHDAVTDDFNGRWARIRIPIPPGYTCNDGDPQDCWVKIRFAYATVDSQVTDVTTWAASLEGDPVRLVE